MTLPAKPKRIAATTHVSFGLEISFSPNKSTQSLAYFVLDRKIINSAEAWRKDTRDGV